MTLFAVACAGIFPAVHIGRPWKAYWLLPYPNTMGLWPQFRSPLLWDVFAVSTYATVSLLFWFVGLIPDLATLRDRAQNKFGQVVYGILQWGGAAPPAIGIATKPLLFYWRVWPPHSLFSPYDCELGLRRVDYPWLAYHHLSTLLCGRSRLLRLRDGLDPHDPFAKVLWSQGIYYGTSSR